tara:strand:+ start:507 stop:1526 length:1020 start_codon:yes stop_codon:yes gene_type:complete
MSSLSFKIDDLGGMKFSEISKLAQKEGIDQDKIDSAMDDDVPKKTLITLLTELSEEKREEIISSPIETQLAEPKKETSPTSPSVEEEEDVIQNSLSNPEKIFLKKLIETYPGLPSINELSSNEELMKMFSRGEETHKKGSPPIEERQGLFDETKCHARVWKAKPGTGGLGYDNIQCSSKHKFGCFCNKHHKLFTDGNLWLGKVTEKRPENPIGPPSSKNPRVHEWCTDSDGNEIVKEKKSKKISQSKSGGLRMTKEEFLRDISKEELVALLKQKEELESSKKVDASSDEENDIYEKIHVDGVDYQYQTEDNSVYRIDDHKFVGKWDKEKGKINFQEKDE